jgi:hypothetical protein
LGPTTAPAGAVTVPAGSDAGLTLNTPNTTYFFATGTHTLGTGQFDQIDPGTGDTYVGASGAILSGQGDNAGAFEGTATGVTIEYLTIEDFHPPGSQGAVNHDSGEGWTIENDTIQDNLPGAGLMVGTNNVVTGNCLTENGEYGFNAYSSNNTSALTGGPSNIIMVANEISFNNTCNWEAEGSFPITSPAGCAGSGQNSSCGCAGGGKFWEVDGATVTGNYVLDNYDVGLWADTNNIGFNVSDNTIQGNFSIGFQYEVSYNANISDNTFINNAWGAGASNPGFPEGAIYLSESGGDSSVPGYSSGLLTISDNTFTNNWSGVVLWESADRFCGSPNNSSSSACTLVDPAVANLNTCDQTNLTGATPSQTPNYYTMCRWKTQNVKVSGNTFNFTKSAIPGCLGSTNSCGENAIFSQYGTSPSWSPYQGTVIETAITTTRGNLFSDNTYTGGWSYMYADQANVLTFSQWQATGQDAAASGSQLPSLATAKSATVLMKGPSSF